MAEIPAPLANRHTAVAVVVVALLGASTAVAAALVPDDATALWLLVVRQVVFVVQALVIALAAALIGRTLVARTRLSLVAILLAGGGLALLALAQLAALLRLTAWGSDLLETLLGILSGAATVATAVGLLLLGVGVIRKGLWHGPTRWTLPLAALLVAAGAFVVPAIWAVWSLVLLGLAAGLTSSRPVANAGVPQGAAPA